MIGEMAFCPNQLRYNMTADTLLRRVIRDSLVIAFAIGVVASLLANWISARLAGLDRWYILTLALGAATIILVWIVGLLAREVAHFRAANEESEISKVYFASGTDRTSFGGMLGEVKSEIAFFGITAKRSVNDDRFKDLLTKKTGRPIRIRFLLLDPTSEAFHRRAEEENESVNGWTEELSSTLHRLTHYRQVYNVDIQVRFYEIYPIWRLTILDNSTVLVNFFLEGLRGTESDQLIMRDATSQWAYSYIKFFNSMWNHHSSIVPEPYKSQEPTKQSHG